jgi:hypothetical protein
VSPPRPRVSSRGSNIAPPPENVRLEWVREGTQAVTARGGSAVAVARRSSASGAGAAAGQEAAWILIRLRESARKVVYAGRGITAPVRGPSVQSNEEPIVNSAETIERVLIHTDADGVVRVAGTRVTLDTVVGAFDTGATAEEIAQQYSSSPRPARGR